MAYKRQNFKDGQVLTAAHMNHIEDGIVALGSSIVESTSGEVIALTDSSNTELAGLKLYGKTTQNGIPTPDAPVPLDSVGADGSVAVTVCGKNLVDVFNENMSVMRDGKTATSYPNIVNADGSLTINIAGSVSYGQGFTKSLRVGQTVTISYFVDSIGNGTGLRLRIFDTNNYSSPKVSKDTTSTGKVTHTFTADADSVYMFGWFVLSGTVPSGGKIHDLQLEFGDTATEYESYKGGSVTVSTPEGLPGIPVASGGNYTDENGQHWVCDEVDFEKGQYIQRVKRVTVSELTGGYNGTNFWFATADRKPGIFNLICSHYPISNESFTTADLICRGHASEIHTYIRDSNYGDLATFKAEMGDVAFLYELAKENPQELTEDELAAYAALHTNYPNTTIFNDEGADMAVKYVADTKLYIDKKFAELAAAIVNS